MSSFVGGIFPLACDDERFAEAMRTSVEMEFVGQSVAATFPSSSQAGRFFARRLLFLSSPISCVCVRVCFFLFIKCNYFNKLINRSLGELYRTLRAEKYNVSFVIVNSDDLAREARVFDRSGLPVLQDIKKMNVWLRHEAKTDDMIIFDK